MRQPRPTELARVRQWRIEDYGKVKMIYIDPPYNTGKELIYPEKYSESLETYLAYAGLVDDEGKKFATNTANEGRFHTRWPEHDVPKVVFSQKFSGGRRGNIFSIK